MKHEQAIKCHLNDRIRTRLNRVPDTREIQKMALALKIEGHPDCFLRQDFKDHTRGIVKYGNIHTVAVLDKKTGLIKTVGTGMALKDTKGFKK